MARYFGYLLLAICVAINVAVVWMIVRRLRERRTRRQARPGRTTIGD
ncbi:MAG: hypothetical protein R3298_10655 [Gammaproteobacteria bacterium]|nr:hypothetical protein [Gammaproteobacteria bacterium]